MTRTNTTIKKLTTNTTVSSTDKNATIKCQIKPYQQSNGVDFGRMQQKQQQNNINCCGKSLLSCWLLYESSGFRSINVILGKLVVAWWEV